MNESRGDADGVRKAPTHEIAVEHVAAVLRGAYWKNRTPETEKPRRCVAIDVSTAKWPEFARSKKT
jgi:hypothetical protein